MNNEYDSEQTIMPQLDAERKPGGLYRHVKMSVKAANILVTVCIAIFIACMVFVVSNNGFTVSFDTNGGSYVQSVKAMHGDELSVQTDPVKEGWSFTGWYTDRECTLKWDENSDVVTDSMTLYSGWEAK